MRTSPNWSSASWTRASGVDREDRGQLLEHLEPEDRHPWRLRAALEVEGLPGPVMGFASAVRVIYYWAKAQDRILLLLVYAKTERDDLTHDQLEVLRRLVEEEYR